jgi:predicted DNA-binding protein
MFFERVMILSQSVKNYTFSLPVDLLSRLKKYSKEGEVPSVNAAVKEAIEEYVKSIDKQALAKKMQAAAKDPLFMEDLEEVMQDFASVDLEAMKENEI